MGARKGRCFGKKEGRCDPRRGEWAEIAKEKESIRVVDCFSCLVSICFVMSLWHQCFSTQSRGVTHAMISLNVSGSRSWSAMERSKGRKEDLLCFGGGCGRRQDLISPLDHCWKGGRHEYLFAQFQPTPLPHSPSIHNINPPNGLDDLPSVDHQQRIVPPTQQHVHVERRAAPIAAGPSAAAAGFRLG